MRIQENGEELEDDNIRHASQNFCHDNDEKFQNISNCLPEHVHPWKHTTFLGLFFFGGVLLFMND